MALREITFEEVKPMWEMLWPGRDRIRPITSMIDGESFDMSIYDKADAGEGYYAGVFYGVFTDDTNELVGVNSGCQTSDTRFRSRGLYVKPGYTGKGVGQFLLQTTIDFAKVKGFEVIWSLPKSSAISTYVKAGFEIIKEPMFAETYSANGVMQYGENTYAELKLK